MKIKAKISIPKWLIPFIVIARITKSKSLDKWCDNRIKNRIKFYDD